MSDFPKLISVAEFGKIIGTRSRTASYNALAQLPNGIVVRIGAKVLINQERLLSFIQSGGSASNDAYLTGPRGARKKQKTSQDAESYADKVINYVSQVEEPLEDM